MTTKEVLFFIGKCLTINHNSENKTTVTRLISSVSVDWDKVVQISTSHYVFPALYINLKRAELLSYLPEELVNYMDHITSLNRERNLEIIKQAKEINIELRKNGITPIFLKGTAFLLQDFYSDPAERMVGDIDFIVSKSEYKQTISILNNLGYDYVIKAKYHFPAYKHYPRLQIDSRIAAIEIHHEMTIDKYVKEFNYSFIKNNSLEINNCRVLSYQDQLTLVAIAKQINDNGAILNTMSFRNAYDLYLLSFKADPLESIGRFELLFKPLNNFIAICNLVFTDNHFSYLKNKESVNSVRLFQKTYDDIKFGQKRVKSAKGRIARKARLEVIRKSFTKRDYAYWLFKRITDPKWYKEKMIQLGIKSET